MLKDDKLSLRFVHEREKANTLLKLRSEIIVIVVLLNDNILHQTKGHIFVAFISIRKKKNTDSNLFS